MSEASDSRFAVAVSAGTSCRWAGVLCLATALACGTATSSDVGSRGLDASSSAPAPDANGPAEADAHSSADTSIPPDDAAEEETGESAPEAPVEAAASADALSPDATPEVPADASSGPYDPCPPPGTPCRIMPLGASITFGTSSTTGGGYRVELFQKALDAHQTIAFVGSQSSGPMTVGGVPFPRGNEGYPGYTIDDIGTNKGILPLTQHAIQTYAPHIVTLLVGTNDINLQLDVANAPVRYGKLLDLIVTTDPNLLLVVAQLPPTLDDGVNEEIVTFNAALPALVQARAQQGRHIRIVDMYGPFAANPNFKTAYLANLLHPNDVGYALMAGVWYAAIGGLFR